jgi:hypothetical protein
MFVSLIRLLFFMMKTEGVGSLRFELKTSSVSGRRHNQLDHEPLAMSNDQTTP